MGGHTILYGLIGGVVPSLVWLYFWHREDAKRPEPKGLLLRTFVLGALAVFLVLPFQKYISQQFFEQSVLIFTLWAFIEELFKFLAGYFGGIHTLEDNEPIDPLIYMITAALGFVALENALFIINPLLQADIAGSVVTGSMRFLGASLLHVVSSGVIGASIALTFYMKRWVKFVAFVFGLVAATILHSLFNLFLLKTNTLGAFYIFATIWGCVALLLLFFEKAKSITQSTS